MIMRLHRGIFCYFLLATLSLVKSVIIADEDPSNVSIKPRQAVPPPEPIGVYSPCPFGESPNDYDYTASWCVDSKTVRKKCVQRGIVPPDVPIVRYNTIRCIPFSYCVGSSQRDVNPRWARCQLVIKKYVQLVTQKVSNSAILQCAIAPGHVVRNANGVAAQVVVDSDDEYEPPMPEDASLFYQGASYPIETVLQVGMNLMSGYVILNYVVDYTQPLQFCVHILNTVAIFQVGYLNPSPSTLWQNSTLMDTNATVFFKRYDNTTGKWLDTELDIDDLTIE